LLGRAYETDQGHPAHRLLSGTTDLPLRAMPQRRNYRSENRAFSAKEVAMTMQTSNPKQSGFLHSVAGQMTVTVVVMIAIILIAWRYVF
jgi:hypothetical protein